MCEATSVQEKICYMCEVTSVQEKIFAIYVKLLLFRKKYLLYV